MLREKGKIYRPFGGFLVFATKRLKYEFVCILMFKKKKIY